jgi:hypothetical protein
MKTVLERSFFLFYSLSSLFSLPIFSISLSSLYLFLSLALSLSVSLSLPLSIPLFSFLSFLILSIFFSKTFNKATQELVTRTPMCTDEELKAAADSSQKAFNEWKETSVSNRVRIMFRLQDLIVKNKVFILLFLLCALEIDDFIL